MGSRQGHGEHAQGSSQVELTHSKGSAVGKCAGLSGKHFAVFSMRLPRATQVTAWHIFLLVLLIKIN